MDRDFVEKIGSGGWGIEAEVTIELRTRFPGLGATIFTNEGVISALRKEHYALRKSAHKLFLKHTIIKKLDDYFYRKRIYVYSHIPRPFGSISSDHKNFEAYLYEWVFGDEGFSWKSVNDKNESCDTELRDWIVFSNHFNAAGIEVWRDITDPENGLMSKNIIHNFSKQKENGIILNSLWRRIDFGTSSLRIRWDDLSKYLRDNKEDLIRVLKGPRYEMILLAIEYLTRKEQMDRKDEGKLEVLVADYRASSLSHYARGMGATTGPPQFAPTTESL